MPCYDERSTSTYVLAKLSPELEKMTALLCGIFTLCDARDPENGMQNLLDAMDWDAIGLKPEDAHEWWAEHKARDAEGKDKPWESL